MQHAELPHDLESEDDTVPVQGHAPGQQDHDDVMLDFDHHAHAQQQQQHPHAQHPHGPHDGPQGPPPDPPAHHHDVGEDLELRNLGSVNDVGAELGLNALRDSPAGVKPFYPYSTLIRE